MIGLDTNILVRYFAQDDAKQSALANRLMGTLTKDEPGFVSAVVLCELVWVLEDVYGLEKSALCNILRTLLESNDLAIESKPVAWSAFNDYSQAPLDFSDALIAGFGKHAGCRHTMTFDKRAARMPAFKLLT